MAEIAAKRVEYAKQASALRAQYREEVAARDAEVASLELQLTERQTRERAALRAFKKKLAAEKQRDAALAEKKRLAEAAARRAASKKEAEAWAAEMVYRKGERLAFLEREQRHWMGGIDMDGEDAEAKIRAYCDAAFATRAPWDAQMEEINVRNRSRATAVKFMHTPKPKFERRDLLLAQQARKTRK